MNQPNPVEPAPHPSRRLQIILEPPRVGGELVRHGCILRRIDGDDHFDTPLWYELPASLPRIPPDDAEPYLIAAIMDAMEEGRDLDVGGRVGYQLLSNIHEFMVVWSRWLPGTFRVVEVTADSISASPATDLPAHDSAVTAHTGGVDATCTLYRHTRGLEGHRSRRITACTMVHGFLIPLDQEEKFAKSLELARNSLEGIGLAVHPVRTNYREAIRAHWNNAYGIAMVSALHFFKPLARSCLVSASKAYDDVAAIPAGSVQPTPYGSNPITNPLLSSDSMQVLHDGARFDFLEKTAIAARWPEALGDLRVCWRGGQIEANCGRCEDCIRTKLAFMALGEPYPASLGAPPTAWEILNLIPTSYDGRAHFLQILAHCRKHRVKAPWVFALHLRVRFDRALVKLLHWKWLVLHLLGRA